MPLYIVEVTIQVPVYAESEIDAIGIAEENAHEEMCTASSYATEMNEGDCQPGAQYHTVIPWGREDDKTCGQIFMEKK